MTNLLGNTVCLYYRLAEWAVNVIQKGKEMKPVKHWRYVSVRKSLCGGVIPKGRVHCTTHANLVTCKRCQNTKLWRGWVIMEMGNRIQKGNENE